MKIFIFCLFVSFNLSRLVLNERYLEDAKTTPQKNATSNSSSDSTTCNQTLMTSYGLTGFSKPVNQAHKYCPGLTRNCCTPQDENLSL